MFRFESFQRSLGEYGVKYLTGMINCWLCDEECRISKQPLFASVFIGVDNSGIVQGISFNNKERKQLKKTVFRSITKHRSGEKRFHDVDFKVYL